MFLDKPWNRAVLGQSSAPEAWTWSCSARTGGAYQIFLRNVVCGLKVGVSNEARDAIDDDV